MTTTPIRLLIADDHPVVRAGLRGMFAEAAAEFVVVGEAADGAEAVRLATALVPDVTLMDLRMPGSGGLAAMRAILTAQPTARVLILTTYDSDQDIMTALQSGAAGYLLKDAPREALFSAIRAAHGGQTALGAAIGSRLVEHLRAPTETLTEREIAVLALAARGETNVGIGRHLHISEATVKTHLKHIYGKLGVSDRAAAVAAAVARNILRLPDDL
jgi:DNA-binding NarL/FixJ family response regulator